MRFKTISAAVPVYNSQATHPSVDVVLTWATALFSYVKVTHNERKISESKYSFWRLFSHAVNMMTGYSISPLRFASIVGFTFMLFGAFILIAVLNRYIIYEYPVAGFPFLASTISIFAGVQLFCIGIIGVYLARMYTPMMDKPTYLIKEIR
jgi:undecaprenyl-phosphate 4-deoxy-4-formamido-L-arabinose transferase